MLAAQSDDTIMVLENGCLCCTVFGDLVTTLNNLYHQREDGAIPRFDHVVIETSGLADTVAAHSGVSVGPDASRALPHRCGGRDRRCGQRSAHAR